MAVDLLSILQHARDLQRATNLQELLDATRTAVQAVAGYNNVWLCVREAGTPPMIRVLAFSGALEPLVWEKLPRFPAEGDAMLAEIFRDGLPVVVEEARTDPRTNKALVEKLGNRTIVNVPLLLGDEAMGAVGFGTFGDEGCRLPSAAQLEQLSIMATHLAAAVQRVRVLEESRAAERESADLRRRLIGVQRIESLAMLAGGIAHDFNNLITVITNSVRFALESPRLDPQQKDDLEVALGAADRAAAITRQLLALGRQQNLHLEVVDLNTSLTALLEMLRRVMPENITIDVIPHPRLPTVQADPSQLDQVFMNLCLNARDAMPDGGRLCIETEQVVINGSYIAAHPWARPGRYVLITVTDTGRGMPLEVQERVFEPFFSTKAASGGTGLGLAIAAGVIEQHGGMINCYSEVGVGTTFKVYLPVFDRSAASVGSKLAGEVPRGQERILVAEDDPGVREIARRILTRAGYTVVTVADGAAAIETALAHPFDLVLLDAVMPVASGRIAQERISAARPQVAFLFASGHSKEVLPAEMLAATGVAMVDKPYHPDDLLRAVRAALDRRAARVDPVG